MIGSPQIEIFVFLGGCLLCGSWGKTTCMLCLWGTAYNDAVMVVIFFSFTSESRLPHRGAPGTLWHQVR